MNNLVHICFCVSGDLFEQLCVAIVSIMENTTENIVFHICSNDLTAFQTAQLDKLKDFYGFSYNIHVVGKTPFSVLDLSSTRFTEDIFNRLLIPDIVPSVSKVLYLDVDVVFQKDVKEFYNIDLGDNYIAAVPEIVCGVGFGAERYLPFLTRIGLKPGDTYCFSGGILLNCDKIRSDGIINRFVSVAQRLQSVWKNPDQDVMNVACLGKILFIDRRFNFAHRDMVRFPDEIHDAVQLHFSSANKPWLWFANYPEKKYWFKYAKKNRAVLGLSQTVDALYVLSEGDKNAEPTPKDRTTCA